MPLFYLNEPRDLLFIIISLSLHISPRFMHSLYYNTWVSCGKDSKSCNDTQFLTVEIFMISWMLKHFFSPSSRSFNWISYRALWFSITQWKLAYFRWKKRRKSGFHTFPAHSIINRYILTHARINIYCRLCAARIMITLSVTSHINTHTQLITKTRLRPYCLWEFRWIFTFPAISVSSHLIILISFNWFISAFHHFCYLSNNACSSRVH